MLHRLHGEVTEVPVGIHEDHPNMKVQLHVQVVTAHNHAVLTNMLGKNEILTKSSVLRLMCGCLHIYTALRPAAALYTYIIGTLCLTFNREKHSIRAIYQIVDQQNCNYQISLSICLRKI